MKFSSRIVGSQESHTKPQHARHKILVQIFSRVGMLSSLAKYFKYKYGPSAVTV